MAKKRIILLLDGTWNDADSGPFETNIVRLRELIAKSLDHKSSLLGEATTTNTQIVAGRTYHNDVEHLVFYERGVGTGAPLDRFKGGAFGRGLEANIRQAYKFLSFYYETDDEIFVFGFSRGAYTARSLIGLIGAAGLLKRPHCTPELEQKVWDFYREAPTDRSPGIWCELSDFVHSRDSFRIQCVGVFDTVGALGIPLQLLWKSNRAKYEFHNVELSSTTNVNLHALAIDEHREPFQATVWRKPKFKSFATTTEQVWFAGVHADVGGGYIIEEARQGQPQPTLDDITLDWMLKRLIKHFPTFPIDLSYWKQIDQISALADQHESRKGYYRIMPRSVRSIGNLKVGVRKHRFEREVCRDRHAVTIGEGLHISALIRLGKIIQHGRRKKIYSPINLLAALPALSAIYHDNTFSADPPIRVIDWSGETLDPAHDESKNAVIALIEQAKHRLSLSN
jgi:Uncharacterized alpha/beta hydrolase domain (DUF2235)